MKTENKMTERERETEHRYKVECVFIREDNACLLISLYVPFHAIGKIWKFEKTQHTSFEKISVNLSNYSSSYVISSTVDFFFLLLSCASNSLEQLRTLASTADTASKIVIHILIVAGSAPSGLQRWRPPCQLPLHHGHQGCVHMALDIALSRYLDLPKTLIMRTMFALVLRIAFI